MSTYSESELNGMTRADLDAIAEEKGLDPADYANKTDEIVAILASQGETPAGDTAPPAPSDTGGTVTETVDPLTDPEGFAQANFPGTTSDASTHTEGNLAKDTPADPSTAPDKATDAEDYKFPTGGDTDVATRDAGSGEGESIAAPTVEDWVILDGEAEEVPDVLDGRRAVIIDWQPKQELYTPEEWGEVTLTVRTRDDYGATLAIPTTAVKKTLTGGLWYEHA